MAFGTLGAQSYLSLDEALREALSNNYGIQVASYNVQTADNNAHPGNARLLPSVTLNGNANYNNNNATADLLTGTDPTTGAPITREQSITGLATSSASASVRVDYTVFDGLGNVYTYRVLQSNAALTREQTRSLVEQTLYQVAVVYNQLARLTTTRAIQAASMDISRTRLARVRNQATFGASNQLAVLNAEVDINSDSIGLAQTDLNLANARRDLNLLLGREIEAVYAVDTTVQFRSDYDWDLLAQQVRENNALLKSADLGRQVSELNLRVAQAARYPRLAVNASYGYNYANNGPISFARTIESYGLAAGASLSFNIFNGGQTSRSIQNAEVSLASSRVQYREAEQEVLRDLAKTYASFQHNLQALALTQKSLDAARLNFERTREAFNLGQSNSVEFRTAQINLLLTENELNNIRFDIKLNEMDMLRLSGQLVSE
ncbi:MAG: TolC family protein [Bacteroidia bacterium]